MKSENKIQQECVIWFTNNYCLKNHVPKLCIFSVPNEGSNVKEQMYKKMLGMKSGVSDLIIVMQGKTLYVECKDNKGRQSDNQKAFEEIVTILGHKYFLIRSLEEFQKMVQSEL